MKLARDIGQAERIKNIVFLEHKINAKSRGFAFIEFEATESAAAFKTHVETLMYVTHLLVHV